MVSYSNWVDSAKVYTCTAIDGIANKPCRNKTSYRTTIVEVLEQIPGVPIYRLLRYYPYDSGKTKRDNIS